MTAAPEPVIDYAHDYADAGLRVVPIAPGRKYPPLKAWQDAATTDRDTIDNWWHGLYRDHGVGLALDQLPDGRWAFAIDIDINSPNGNGHDTWHDLCATHGNPPATVEAVTGSGGTHLIYAAPVEIRNDQAGKVGPGIDVRGHGGQILVEPTIHPNGQPYAWVDGHAPWQHPIANAPDWLLELVNPPQPEPSAPPSAPSAQPAGDRPGDLWAAQTSWADLLEPDGWQHHHTDTDGVDYWTRPGKALRDGPSATTGYAGTGGLKVFTSSVAHLGLEQNQTYSKLGYLAATKHGGDHSAAASALRAAGHHTPEPDIDGWLDSLPTTQDATSAPQDATNAPEQLPHGWEPVDLHAIVAGDHQPVTPDLGARHGGGHLFYSGRVNALYAPSGTGKSWIAMWACVEAINNGSHVVYVDLEDHATSVVDRFLALGANPDQLADQLTYIAPEQAWNPHAAVWLRHHITDTHAAAVVIDSTGEAMALDGAAPNDDDATAMWFRRLPRLLADTDPHPAIILTDHVPKSKERPKGFAMGSQRKRAAIDGIAYEVECKVAPSRGTTGHLAMICAKDRNGAYSNGHKVADVHIASAEGTSAVGIKVEAPPDVFRPTGFMEKVSRLLEDEGVLSGTYIKDTISGKNEHVVLARELLVAEGYIDVRERQGRGGGLEYESIRPYREDTEWLPIAVDNDEYTPTRNPSQPVPNPSRDGFTDPPPNPSPVPPPLRGDGTDSVSVRDKDTDQQSTTTTEPVPTDELF